MQEYYGEDELEDRVKNVHGFLKICENNTPHETHREHGRDHSGAESGGASKVRLEQETAHREVDLIASYQV